MIETEEIRIKDKCSIFGDILGQSSFSEVHVNVGLLIGPFFGGLFSIFFEEAKLLY